MVEAAEPMGLTVNIEKKTKAIVFGKQEYTENVTVNGDKIAHLTEFEYLGSLLLWDND